MIKKISLLSLISTLSFLPSLHAGDMGGMDFNNSSSFFLALEGSYTRNSINNYSFTLTGTDAALVSIKDNKLYGARFSGGLMTRICDEFAASGEIGWGYYGRTNLNPEFIGTIASFPGTLTISNSLSGFDALLGVYYTQPCFNLFLKGGALIENRSTNFDGQFNPLAFPFSGTLNVRSSRTQALPEIKIGGSYNLSDNWAITLAYMHAFGNNVQTIGTFDPITFQSSLFENTQVPSLDSGMFGLQFCI